MLKKLPFEEGPHELEINRLFSKGPLASNPRNHCAPLLDVIQLPNDPPIMVHSLLRPFYDPRLQTFGEFVSFFSQVCEVSLALPLLAWHWVADLTRVCNSCTRTMSHIGTLIFIFHFSPSLSAVLISCYPISGTVRRKTSCSTHQTCIPTRSTPLTWPEVKIFVEKQEDIHELGALHDIFSLTLAFPAGTTQQMGLRWMNRYMEEISRHPNFRTASHHTIHSLPTFTTLET